MIQKVYDDISYETINDLMDTFPYRIQMVYDHGGKTIAHFIPKNYHHIPEKYIVPKHLCQRILLTKEERNMLSRFLRKIIDFQLIQINNGIFRNVLLIKALTSF